MPAGAVFTATALAAIVGTLAMALLAKMPFGLAPGMGLNAFFVYTVCMGMGYSWQFALTAVFIEGLIFIVLTLSNLREAIVNAIPDSLKNAIGAGIVDNGRDSSEFSAYDDASILGWLQQEHVLGIFAWYAVENSKVYTTEELYKKLGLEKYL
jgi:hypothetical protein